MKTITRDQIKQHLDNHDKIVLIEALPEKYYEDGHLPGALQILPEKIKELAPQLLTDKNQLIVTYCANTTCPNSKTAAELLIGLGYKNVAEYVEGKQDWVEAGLPLEKGSCCVRTQAKKVVNGGGCCG